MGYGFLLEYDRGAESGRKYAAKLRADIQDVLGHESDKMARHYAGEARKFAAANLMMKYSLAG